MNKIFNKTVSALKLVEKMTNERILQFPNYGPYNHARAQIAFIKNVLSQKRPPTEKETSHVDIALMAIKELDAAEPDYSEALCDLSFWFKKI